MSNDTDIVNKTQMQKTYSSDKPTKVSIFLFKKRDKKMNILPHIAIIHMEMHKRHTWWNIPWCKKKEEGTNHSSYFLEGFHISFLQTLQAVAWKAKLDILHQLVVLHQMHYWKDYWTSGNSAKHHCILYLRIMSLYITIIFD